MIEAAKNHYLNFLKKIIMKKIYLLAATALLSAATMAQTDSTKTDTTRSRIIKIGNIIVMKIGGKNDKDSLPKIPKKPSKVTTHYFNVDFGLSNYNDQTNYASTGNYLINNLTSPGFSESDFRLRTGKSVNVNIWFVTQQLAIVKNNVHLKYGLGVELNNYRYKQPLSYKESGSDPYRPTFTPYTQPFIFRDSISFSKNKLAADYLTVPLMITVGTNKAGEGKGIRAGFGVSAGYLYSQRNKQVSNERGKQKNKGDYDLEKFKLSYVGELTLGPVQLYGTYSPNSFYKRELNMKPYTIGIRFGKN